MQLTEMLKLSGNSLRSHKLRSALTALGIIFGVGAVISMLSIGEGARQEALRQIQLMGVNNIIVRSVKPPEASTREALSDRSWSSRYGISFLDVEHVKRVIPSLEQIVPARDVRKQVWYLNRTAQVRVLATTPNYTEVMRCIPQEGRFLTTLDNELQQSVCVLGANAARELLGYHEPLGKQIKIGDDWFEVVGVLRETGIGGGGQSMATHDLDRDIYIPMQTALSRFGVLAIQTSSGNFQATEVQVDELHCKVTDSDLVEETAELIRQIFTSRHQAMDWELVVPKELLRQSQKTQAIFSIVMGSIAGISLLVGGIGIMNIMLANITERTREIGIRRALGARRRDITQQFLVETIVLTLAGGLIGIVLGILLARVVTQFSQWPTIVSGWSLFVAFGISAAVGLVFGIYPARKAANMDPIEALRYE